MQALFAMIGHKVFVIDGEYWLESHISLKYNNRICFQNSSQITIFKEDTQIFCLVLLFSYIESSNEYKVY